MLYNELIKIFPDIKKEVLLKKYTTFRIGGRAKYFLVVKKSSDLVKAIKLAKKFSLPFFILGGGSNVLVRDEGYKGITIKVKSSKKIKEEKSQAQSSKKIPEQIIVECQAGTPLSRIVSWARENSLTGLEWAIGIPGTIGGAIRGNAGAFGKSIGDIIEEVKIFDSGKLIFKDYKKKDCYFTYRGSLFKKDKNFVIISAVIRLKRGNKKEVESKMKEYLEYRREHQPLSFPSAGSVFENYQGTIKNNDLLNKFPQLLEFNRKKFIPAGFLIDKCGLKGKTIGMAKVSEEHANFIINLGGAKSSDVISLIGLIKREVKKKFGIILKREIEIL